MTRKVRKTIMMMAKEEMVIAEVEEVSNKQKPKMISCVPLSDYTSI